MDDDVGFNSRLMFEAYLYDYLKKKNMHQTAEIYRKEANLEFDPDFRPAMDIPGGFLQEWWSIFYDYFNSQQQGGNNQRNDSLIMFEQMMETLQQTNASPSNEISSQQTSASSSKKINLQRTDGSLSNKNNSQQNIASPLKKINLQQTNASLSNKNNPQQNIAPLLNKINAQQVNTSLLNQLNRNENTIDQLAQGASGLIMKQNAMGSMMGPSTEAQRVEVVALPSHQQEPLKFSSSRSTSSSIFPGIPAKPMGQEAAYSGHAATNCFILPSEISQVSAGYRKRCWDLEFAKNGREIRNQSDSRGPRSSRIGVPPSISETPEAKLLAVDNSRRSVSSHNKEKKNMADDVYKKIT
ncbi:transcriptional corepressor LEUNIG-like isoform X2 [Carica papaya]|uniref:transcriptional corepressor LEUNIG-like isoform X2 n=1 Tax=Carica papaya TaxID=3649 RepID=UPI000B8C707F|nr:transcriptional corepressor LEUNIG-like isoform X2 [Carica papaya]